MVTIDDFTLQDLRKKGFECIEDLKVAESDDDNDNLANQQDEWFKHGLFDSENDDSPDDAGNEDKNGSTKLTGTGQEKKVH